jgi:O-antigen ligase
MSGLRAARPLDRRLAAPGLALIAMLAVYLVGGDVLAARFREGGIQAQTAERLALYELALRAIADSWWRGTGFGSFPEIFQIYRTTHSDLQPGGEFVHNTFLQIILESGLPAAFVYFAVLAYCAGQCFSGVRRRHLGRAYPALGAAATVLAGLHSVVDFGLEIPAVAMAYAFLLGLGFGQAWSGRRNGRSRA